MQCLTASSLNADAVVTMKLCSQDRINPLQEFLTVAGLSEGAHPLTTVGQLRFAADPSLCVAREGYRDQSEHNYVPSHDAFVLRKCNSFPAIVHFEFELLA